MYLKNHLRNEMVFLFIGEPNSYFGILIPSTVYIPERISLKENCEMKRDEVRNLCTIAIIYHYVLKYNLFYLN